MDDVDKERRRAIRLSLRDENRKWRAQEAELKNQLEELKDQQPPRAQPVAQQGGNGSGMAALLTFVLAPPLFLVLSEASVGTWIIVVCVQSILGVLYVFAHATPDERKDWDDRSRFGQLNPELLCQHCGTKGHVRTQTVSRKKGVSGGKATAAVLTGGVSLLATGLSRKEKETEAHCTNCRSTWHF